MLETKKVIVECGIEEKFETTIKLDNGRYVADLRINGVLYHFEQMPKEEFVSLYKVDQDPDYEPKSDEDGMCFIIAPFPK